MEVENTEFLTTQIITYIGNKRLLIGTIEIELERISEETGKKKMVCADLFSGSGIVARMMKQHSSMLITNDLEAYSELINSCYLTDSCQYPADACREYRTEIDKECRQRKIKGIIAGNYAPANDNDIKRNERAFYTKNNALLIDTYRQLIDDVVKEEELKKYFIAPLVTEASVHVNTSGVFKGFYKDKNTGIGCFGGAAHNALTRIYGRIELKEPVFSNFNSHVEIYKKDAVELSGELGKIDVAYLDPPYNQHPYGSNYFMLNLIIKNRLDVGVSRISGITQDWNHSVFNRKETALNSMEKIIDDLQAAYIIVSYNSEGFISFTEMTSMLRKYGKIRTIEIKYNTFRGCRNLDNRDIHVSEYLFILMKQAKQTETVCMTA